MPTSNPQRRRLTGLLAALLVLPLFAGTPPPTPVVMDPATAEAAAFKTEKGATVALTTAGSTPVLRLDLPAGAGYPGFDIPVTPGGWDLSAFSGLEVEVANIGTTRINLGLRVDNPGDWKKSPWNTNNVWLAPGEVKRLQVTFGQSFGRPGYALNPADITAAKIFADNPTGGGTLLIKSIRGFGTGAPAAGASAPAATIAVDPFAASGNAAPAATPPAPAPGASGPIFTPASADLAAIKTEKDPVLSLEGDALKVAFPRGGDYPGLDFPLAGGQLNLAGFAGIQAEVTNLGSSALNVNLRADNPGDWRKSPWNTGNSWIGPGQTATVKVVFGQSYGNPGYALDPARISNLKLFVANPKTDAAILVRNVAPFGTAAVSAAVPPAASAPTAPPPAAAGQDATFSPAIGGDLLDLPGRGLAGFNYADSTAVLENGRIKVTFRAGANYPNIQFPIPAGGWNLSAFGAAEITVTNPNDRKVTVFMRVDNPGHWKNEPWNTENTTVDPGETKVLRLTFGQQNGAPAFPLNPARVNALQVFIVRPKTDTTLLLSDLKAAGSPADAAHRLSLTKPEDRNTPAVLPDWLGQRPPPELAGEWVQTLNENFDGDRLDASRWTPRFPWDGPQPGQLQRYAPENVTVAGGVATFKVEKRAGHENNDTSLGRRDYTSGLIQSYDKWTQLYGYFEARVKVPYVRGLWPAFWMMPDRGPASGLDMWRRRDTGNGAMEIDIMEILSEWGPGRNSVAVHWDGYGSDHKQWGTSQIYYGPTPDGYHVFGLAWEPGKLTWYVDGKKTAELVNDRVSSVPAYLKFNVQMGGWATKNIDDAGLPATMEVDYARAWQLRSRL